MKENIKFKAVRRKKFACALRDQGFELLEKRANYKYPDQDVYIFEKTPEFQNALNKLFENM